jgi:hypothetical protein
MTNFAHRKLKKGVKNLREKENHVSEQITRDFFQDTVPTEGLCEGPKVLIQIRLLWPFFQLNG